MASASCSASASSGAPELPFCEKCVSGTVHAGTATGADIKLGSLHCYYAAPPLDLPPAPTILFLTDVFGYSFINARLLADAFARENFHVLVPDLFAGDPIDSKLLNFVDEEAKGWFGGLWKGLQFTSVVPTFIPWLMRHGDAATLPIVEEALKEGRAWATAKGNGRLGAVGFCFGGRYAILAAGGTEPRVDAYVAVHPSQVGVPVDVEAVRRPGLFILAEVDPRFSGSTLATVQRILGPGTVAPAEFVTYPGTEHGFAIRGPPRIDAQRAQARDKVAAWFKAQLA